MAKAKKTAEVKEVRIPIVTILGHVDHGKTSLLDKIRESNVQAGEAGGITQKVSVFTVAINQKDENGANKQITFIDTPGHEAFDLMRSRGGQIADVVLLIVAADDGLKPQTEESIEIIKASKSHPIVVITKVDLPDINLDKIKRELSVKGIMVEGMGGDVPVVEVSAKDGTGIDTLLDTISLVIDVHNYIDRAELPTGAIGKAFVLESIKDVSKGNVSTVVMLQGDASTGKFVAYEKDGNTVVERIKGFLSEEGDNVDALNTGSGGKILGLSNLVSLGSEIFIVADNDAKVAKEIVASNRKIVAEEEAVVQAEGGEADDEAAVLLSQMFGAATTTENEEEGGKLNVLLKCGSEGALEAVRSNLLSVDIEGYSVNIVLAGVGDITQSDIEKAAVTKAIVLGFEVQVDTRAEAEAKKSKVLVRTYDIVYKLLEEITDALTSMATPKESEEELGEAEIRQIFTLTDGSQILGGRVTKGLIKRGERCYVVRGDDIIVEGKIVSLRQGKNAVNEAPKGADFGAGIDPKSDDVKEGDVIYCFKVNKN
ncbi:MAG: GTP-binding protein [Candidatus Dojkabacteria bacterium]|nr:MAG: GTP-binding protein [Candidatus Dojkabacteria bacterium]